MTSMMVEELFYSKHHGIFKMKAILLFLILTSSIFALSINDSLLKVHATLVPKIYLMDYKFKDKLKNNTIIIAIMYERHDYKHAKKLQELIESRYKDGIKHYNVAAKLVNYKNIANTEANIYYLLPSNSKIIKKVVDKAASRDALTFSYLNDDLKHGVMISLNVSKKIKPLLNLEAIKTHKITLRPVLINISTIYKSDLGSSLQPLELRGFNFYRVHTS